MTKSYYLTYDQRLTIERMIDKGFKPPTISHLIGVHLATLYRELKRGQINGGYSADVAQVHFNDHMKQRGRKKRNGTGAAG